MKYFLKTFDKLEKEELYQILKLRQDVFILEQESFYTDIDNIDQKSYHLFIKNDRKIIAYLRIFEKDGKIIIGRIISRKKGLGSKIVKKAINESIKIFGKKYIKISAQVRAMSFYKKFGFKEISKPYDDGGINHIDMILK